MANLQLDLSQAIRIYGTSGQEEPTEAQVFEERAQLSLALRKIQDSFQRLAALNPSSTTAAAAVDDTEVRPVYI
jgi:hypothetical protein